MARQSVKAPVPPVDCAEEAALAPKKPRVSYRGRRNKGSRFERQLADAVGGKRVPLSGAAKHLGKEFSEDVMIPIPPLASMMVQCKALRDGWKTLYGLLGTADLLALKADGKEPLIVLPLGRFVEMLNGYRFWLEGPSATR